MTRFFLGLDLGQRADHSALAVLERAEIPTGEFDRAHWRPFSRLTLSLRLLRRWPLGVPYLDIARWSLDTVRELSVRAPVTLALDASGPGAPLYEIFRTNRPPALLQPVIITSGHRSSTSADSTHLVPRDTLFAQLRLALENRDLIVSPKLPFAQNLCAELTAYGRNGGEHDDLAVAVALAVDSALRATRALRRLS